MSRAGKITRRSLLVVLAAVASGVAGGVAGGVAFGYWRFRTPYPNPLLAGARSGEAVLTPYVRIDAAGVTVIAPRAEMGQGVQSALAALVAEAMDLDLAAIRIEHGPPDRAYFNQGCWPRGRPFWSPMTA